MSIERDPSSPSTADEFRERQLDLLCRHLPDRVQRALSWLRRPSSRWLRIPVGVLFILGGLLFILPLLGLWMLPVGLVLLAEDVRPLRRATDRALCWIELRRPHWMGLPHQPRHPSVPGRTGR